MNCKNCKFYITQNLSASRKRAIPEGWGYCTCPSIRTLDNGWHHSNESNSAKNSIFTSSAGIGFLSEEFKKQEVFGQFIVGENFGCIHFRNDMV